MEFDHNGKPVPHITNSKSNRGVVVGTIMAIIGVVMVIGAVWNALHLQKYEPALTADAPTVTMVSAVATATIPMCEPFKVQVGDVCRYEWTPTPIGKCPAPTDGGLCIYDGPLSLRPRQTPTPIYNGVGGVTPPDS